MSNISDMKTLTSKMIIGLCFVFALPLMLVGQTKESVSKIEIKTSAICGDCEERIEHDLSFAKGVKKVTLNSETKVVTVDYNPQKSNPEALRKAINRIGYDADDHPADAAAYKKLPACCKKGNVAH